MFQLWIWKIFTIISNEAKVVHESSRCNNEVGDVNCHALACPAILQATRQSRNLLGNLDAGKVFEILLRLSTLGRSHPRIDLRHTDGRTRQGVTGLVSKFQELAPATPHPKGVDDYGRIKKYGHSGIYGPAF